MYSTKTHNFYSKKAEAGIYSVLIKSAEMKLPKEDKIQESYLSIVFEGLDTDIRHTQRYLLNFTSRGIETKMVTRTGTTVPVPLARVIAEDNFVSLLQACGVEECDPNAKNGLLVLINKPLRIHLKYDKRDQLTIVEYLPLEGQSANSQEIPF